MEFSPRMMAIRRRWKVVAVVGILAAAGAYAGSFMLAPSYSSTATVLVRAREASFLTSTGENLTNQIGVLDSHLAKTLGETVSGMVKSNAVAERVVTELSMDERPRDVSIASTLHGIYRFVFSMAVHGSYAEPDSFTAAVSDVINRVEATPIKDSYLVEITARASDAALAADIANSAATALIEMSRERFQSDADAHRDFLLGQVERAREAVTAAEAAIREYKEEQGIADIGEELRLSAGTRHELEDELQRSDVELQALRAELAAMEEVLRTTNSTSTSTMNIATGRSSTQTTTTGPNPVHQALASQVGTLEADIASLEARRSGLASLVEGGGLPASVLPGQEARLSELLLQLTTTTDAYRSIRSSYEAALVNSAQGAVEVSQTDAAVAAFYPDGPVRPLYVIVGLLFGAGGGALLAILLERWRNAPAREVFRPPRRQSQPVFNNVSQPEPTPGSGPLRPGP